MDFTTVLFNYTYWTWIGTLYLLILTYQDYKNNMWVDDRKNAFMMGISMSLLSHFPVKVWYLFLLIACIMGFRYYALHKEVFGEADVNTLTWVFLGLGIINVFYLGFFAVVFMFCALLYELGRRFVFKYNEPAPFYIVILVSFVASMLVMGLYW